jgi:hypothetical protein
MSNVLLITPEQHFNELLKEACDKLDFKIAAASQSYILNLLKFYIDSRNLYSPFIDETMEKPPETFAELYLTALNLESPKNKEYMKILADRALYLSGFFGESLQKKSVDIDYYMGIGASAYQNLATWTKEETTSIIYSQFSNQFTRYVNLLSYMSDKSAIQSEQNILKLYERYVQTGSQAVREKLNALGLTTLPVRSQADLLKKSLDQQSLENRQTNKLKLKKI